MPGGLPKSVSRQQRRAGRRAGGVKGAGDGGVAGVEDDHRLAAAERGVHHLEPGERHVLRRGADDERPARDLRPAQLGDGTGSRDDAEGAARPW